SGPPTPSARKTRSTRLAACRDDTRHNRGPALRGSKLLPKDKDDSMTLRADHVAGAFFVAFGLLVIALSGDLPTGNLSLPGSGFLPKIIAVLTIFFGLVLILRAKESRVFATLSWSDAK